MEKYFLKMIVHARQESEVVLYRNILNISEAEMDEVVLFLESEYKQESLSYPYTTPGFDKGAAKWAAHLFYIASQLLLYREQKIDEVSSLISPHEGEITPAAILSADLMLRFVPNIITELKLIDDSDALIDVLEKQLHIWHYSAIGYQLNWIDDLDMSIIVSDNCLKLLYIDRVIEKEAKQMAKHPTINLLIKSALGMYQKEFWPKFE